MLKQNIPREVRAAETLNAVVFTDACYKRNSVDWPCGIGGVFFFQQEVCFFSLKVNAAAREALGELVKKQIIFEAEALAAVIAFRVWLPRFTNRRCILFVDNEGTKCSLLRGPFDNLVVIFLAEHFVELEASMHAFTWLASAIQLQCGRCTVQG